MGGVWHVLTRRKILDESSDILKHNRLSRQLGTGDLIALGVGSTLGLGVYVLAGHVAKDFAGPSVILSFLIAALASVFAGLCYAEFGARVPRAGSAYVYSYVCVGEFIAFVIGWNLILEYVIGSASVSRGISLYLDTILNDTLKTTFRDIAPMNVSFMSEYFDLLAFGLAFFFGVILAFGMKESATLNNVFTIINIGIVLFVIIAGSIKADFANWNIVPEKVDPIYNVGVGGFFPFGFAGTLKGAATCFFGFVGFDCIATTGEEVHNPKRAIPISIVTSLAIIFLAYFGISMVLTLMWPYYLQDADAPIPFVFGEVGWAWAKWVVAIGGMFGLLSSLFGSMFPLPRILYAMASDGLVFKFFGSISPRFKSPVIGTIMASLLTGIMAGLFELSHLVNMMSIGTLMAYTIVAACVLLLRFNCEFDQMGGCSSLGLFNDTEESYSLLEAEGDDEEDDVLYCSNNDKFEREVPTMKEGILPHESSYLMSENENFSISRTIKQLFNCGNANPSRLSSVIVGSLISLYCLFSMSFSLMLIFLIDDLEAGSAWVIVLTSIFGAMMLVCMLLISLQPRSNTELSFKVPLVPLVPCLSIFINIHLMLMLDVYTWVRFGVWMAVGIPIYVLSLHAYERGGNYLMYAQKSSIKSKISGNLNYAFENMEQCQERAVSFMPPDVKITVQTPTPPDANTSVEEETPPNNTNHNGFFVPLQEIRLRRGNEIISSEDIDEATNSRNLLRESFIEIEKLDQVLQDEEEASKFSDLEPVIEDAPLPNIVPLYTEYSDYSRSPSASPPVHRKLSSGEGDGSLVVSSKQNVVVLVHREDDKPTTKPRATSMLSISGVLPSDNADEDNVSTSNEDVHLRRYSSAENVHSNDNDLVFLEKVVEEPAYHIPPPPPMDEIYFGSQTMPQVRARFTKVRPREPEPDYDDVEVKPRYSDSTEEEAFVPLKIGTDRHKSFSDKLSAVLKKQTGGIFSKKKRLRRSSSQSALENGQVEKKESFRNVKEAHRSEPSLFAALKKEIVEHKRQAPLPPTPPVAPVAVVGVKTPPSPKPSEVSSRRSSISNKTDHTSGNETEGGAMAVKTLSRKDLKLKLESILAISPVAIPRPTKRPTLEFPKDDNNSESEQPNSINSDSLDSEKPDEIIKPKKDAYTNTMKLRYGNVLKAIQLKGQNDSNADIDKVDKEDRREAKSEEVR